MNKGRRTKKDKEDVKVCFKDLKAFLKDYRNRENKSEQLISDFEAKLAEYQEQIFKDAMDGV